VNALTRRAMGVLLATLAVATAQSQTAPVAPVRSQTVQNAPPGWVGRKTTDREHREDSLGQYDYLLTFGGFVRKCPTSGGFVEGNFEFSITYDAASTGDDGVIRREHHSRRLTVVLEGEVGPDAKLMHVDMTGDFIVDRSGTDVPSTSESREIPSRRFTPGRAGEPDFSAMEAVVTMTADVAAASVILAAGTMYRDAEAEWLKLNECVEFTFEPPTDTQQLGPSEARQVRVELRSKGDGATVPWQTDNINAIQGVGSVAPRRLAIAESTPATLTYTASARPRRGNGIDVAGTSRAGVGNGQWRIVDRFEGTFSQTRTTVVGPDNVPNFADSMRRYGIGASQDYELTGRLVWTTAEAGTRTPQFTGIAATTYVPTDGELTIEIGGEGRSMVGACTYEGSKTFAIRELPPAALQYLQLDVAADNRYKLMLGMISYYLQFQDEVRCEVMGRRVQQPIEINDAAIALGVQEGVVTNDTVRGETPMPISYGIDRITGRWEFKKPGAPP
jgi:hypothetical protein